MSEEKQSQDEMYDALVMEFGPALQRLGYAYERDPDKRTDLLQDIHFSIWQSLKIFDGRSSLRTWVYRVAHNTAASYVAKAVRKSGDHFLTLDNVGEIAGDANHADDFEKIDQLDQLMALIERLKPPDRQLIILYLEDLDAQAMSQITGLSPGAVTTRIHRIKTKLTELYRKGNDHDLRHRA